MEAIHTTSGKNAHKKFPKQPMEKQMIPKYTLGMRASLINTPTSTNY